MGNLTFTTFSSPENVTGETRFLIQGPSSIKIHPDYSVSALDVLQFRSLNNIPQIKNDLAIIRLPWDVTLSDTIQVVVLPDPNPSGVISFEGMPVNVGDYAAGYGWGANGSLTTSKQEFRCHSSVPSYQLLTYSW